MEQEPTDNGGNATSEHGVKPAKEGSIPDDASSTLVELDAPFNEADPLIKPIKDTISNTFPTILVTDMAIELNTVTVTVCEGGTGATYKNTITED